MLEYPKDPFVRSTLIYNPTQGLFISEYVCLHKRKPRTKQIVDYLVLGYLCVTVLTVHNQTFFTFIFSPQGHEFMISKEFWHGVA